MSEADLNCGTGGGATTFTGLRIASVFIIWTMSSFGATFPIVAHRSRVLNIPRAAFEYGLFLDPSLPEFHFSPMGAAGPQNISARGSSSPPRLSTSSPPVSASFPLLVLEVLGKNMCALPPPVHFYGTNSDWRPARDE